MSEQITLRAKSDGTEISGELTSGGGKYWVIRLAPNTSSNSFWAEEWDRVYELPTTPGTVFRATVRDVPNVRVVVTSDDPMYLSPRDADFCSRHDAKHIDASTVVIELKGDES